MPYYFGDLKRDPNLENYPCVVPILAVTIHTSVVVAVVVVVVGAAVVAHSSSSRSGIGDDDVADYLLSSLVHHCHCGQYDFHGFGYCNLLLLLNPEPKT